MQDIRESVPGLGVGLPSVLLGVLIGTAFGPIAGPPRSDSWGIYLAEARAEADSLTRWRPNLRAVLGSGLSTSTGGEYDSLLFAIFVTVVVVMQYAKHARVVANVLV